MKNLYKKPETELVILRTSSILQDEEQIENSGVTQNPKSNEIMTFDEGELPTDLNKSSLWDN